MKTKTLSILFALVMILSMSVGVFAQDPFEETWDENTVLTILNDVGMVFPDLFADIDSDFLFEDIDPQPFNNLFPTQTNSDGTTQPIAKAPIEVAINPYPGSFTYDPCGDGLIKFEVELTKMSLPSALAQNYYYGDENVTYIKEIRPVLTLPNNSTVTLGLKKCDARGGEGCSYITYRRNTNGAYTAKMVGYLTVPGGIVIQPDWKVTMEVDFSDYFTALWPVNNTQTNGPLDSGTVYVEGLTVPNTGRRDYCQDSLELYGTFPNLSAIRAKYDQNTGEARLQVIVRNLQPDIHRQNYVIPAEVFAFIDANGDGIYNDGEVSQRITSYTCKSTIYNVANAAPRTDYCKFGEGIAIADHGMVKIDISIDHFNGAILRAADGGPVNFAFRVGGMIGMIDPNTGNFVDTGIGQINSQFLPVDFPCPPVTRMLVLDPLVPFLSSFPMLSDDAIEPSGAYGVYEGGLWGMYQKCGKFAYVMVRLKNDGVKEEVINLKNTSVAINGGTPMAFRWILSTVDAFKGKIILDGGDCVILIGRAKVTDIPSQLNSDLAMTGAVNFTDFGLYITGCVYSDHNNTNCVAAPK
jgi:hypothetical protein